MAIDLGGTRTKLGLVQGERILRTDEMDSQASFGLLDRLPEIVTRLNALLEESALSIDDVIGVGIAIPGIVDTLENKVLVINDKFGDAPQIDFVRWASSSWGLRVRLENDARAALLGEWRFGVGRGFDNVVQMTLGTGIGTSAVMDGHLLRGKHYQGGILGGHFIINQNGPLCNCGNVGCAEAQASTWNLGRLITSHDLYKQSSLAHHNSFDFKLIFHQAEQGDALARIVRDECLEAWATCALNLVQAYDPELLILGGGVMRSHKHIIPHIQRKLDQNGWGTWGNVNVVQASMLNSAALLGVASLLDN